MPRKASSKSKKAATRNGSLGCCPKDGHGMHWHALLWIIVITVFFSTIILVYSAGFFSTGSSHFAVKRYEVPAHLNERFEALEERIEALEKEGTLMEESVNDESEG